jgi:hypothetical protein
VISTASCRRVGATALVALAMLPACTSANGVGADRAPDTVVSHPLDGPLPSGFSIIANVGDKFTNGMLVVHNRGDEDIELLDVRPRVSNGGLRFLGAKIAGSERRVGSIQTLPAWPPVSPDLGDLEPAAGARLPAGADDARAGVEVLLGFEVRQPGRSTVTGVDLEYRLVGSGDRRKASFTSTMAVCTIAAACEMEYGDN